MVMIARDTPKMMLPISKFLLFGSLLCFLTPCLVYPDDEPFARYPGNYQGFVKSLHESKPGTLAFRAVHAGNVSHWREAARDKLVDLLGLKHMQSELSAHQPGVELEMPEDMGAYLRFDASIETEPGFRVPFWLLKPKSKAKGDRYPLAICSHGHDMRGRDTYAGVWHDDGHRQLGLSRGGPIAVQAVERGFLTLVPATRGLAKEASLPDLKGRHGKRPCRAQLMHALIAGRTAVGERVWDIQRLLDWALKRSDVDPSRVIMTGNSGGGVLTVHTAAIDGRITVAVPSCSFTSFTSETGYIFHCDCCLIPRVQSELGDFSDIGGLIAPRALLAVNGKKDTLHYFSDVEKAMAHVSKIYRATGDTHPFKHEWGEEGHQFYPEIMWPFVEKWTQK